MAWLLLPLLALAPLWAGCNSEGQDGGGHPENSISRFQAMNLALEAVAEQEGWSSNEVMITSSKTTNGWRVTAWKIEGKDNQGKAVMAPEGQRIVHLGADGALADYVKVEPKPETPSDTETNPVADDGTATSSPAAP